MACCFIAGCKQSINYETFPIEKHADTPPMGWNSWNYFGADITEAELKSQVDYIAENLKQFGYEYVVIDLGWYDPTGSGIGKTYKRAKPELDMDEYGRLIPSPNRFPSCKNGSFKPIADYIHSKGLKFGIHIMRGIPWEAVEKDLPIKNSGHSAKEIVLWDKTCVFYDGMRSIDMSKPGAQEYYNSIAELYAEWEVDFIKADDMISYPPKYDEMKALRYAMENNGRDMVLSLSPGHINFWDRNMCAHFSEMYRVSGDVWDKWEHMERAFKLANQFNEYSGPGGWADLDMLVLGNIGARHEFSEEDRPCKLSKAEQKSHVTLWAIAKSPLMLGMDLTQLDKFTTSLITNKHIIQVNQQGNAPRQIYNEKGIIIWESNIEEKDKTYIVVFNTNDKVWSDMQSLDLKHSTNFIDIWNSQSITKEQLKHVQIAPHDVLFLQKNN
jgi:hypothetical protein